MRNSDCHCHQVSRNSGVCNWYLLLTDRTATVPGPDATTVTRTNGDWCYSTITKTSDRVDCKTAYVTSTKTNTPTVYVTAPPSRTVTVTQCAATKTICANKWKRSEIPEDLTNAQLIQLGLQPRGPREKKKRTWWLHDDPPAPSCTPTTITSTATSTKTVPGTVTATTTSCYLTSTKWVYNTQYTTYTSTKWSTTAGPPVTKTKDCLYPATTTIKTTATVTKNCYWK